MVDISAFAPPSAEDLMEAPKPYAAAQTPQADISAFAPPSAADIDDFAPPSEEDLQDEEMPDSYEKAHAKNKNLVLPEEIHSIAKSEGLDPTALDSIAKLYGATRPGESKLDADYVIGFLGRSVALGFPQYKYKKDQEPAVRRAIDKLQNLIDERRSGFETAAEIGTGIGASSAAGIVLKGATKAKKVYDAAGLVLSPAAQGYFTSEEGKELEGARDGALLGLGLGAAGYGIAKGVKKVFGGNAAEAVEEVGEELAEKGKNLEERVAVARKAEAEGDDAFIKSINDAPIAEPKVGKDGELRERFGELLLPTEKELAGYAKARGLGEDLERAAAHYQDEVREFAKVVKSAKTLDPTTVKPSFKESKELIRDFRESQGAEELFRRYDEYRNAATAKRVLENNLDSILTKAGTVNPVRQAIERVIDGTHAARAIDGRLGLTVERTLIDLSQQNNLYTKDLQKAIQGLDVLEEAIHKTGIAPEKLYEALDTGVTAGLTPAQLGVVQAFKKKYDDLAEMLQKRGVPVQKRQNYVPRQMVPFVDAILKIEERLVGLKKQGLDVFNVLDDDEFTRLMDPDSGNKFFQDTVRGIEFLNHTEIKNVNDFLTEAALALNPKTAGVRSELTAGAAMARMGRIPEFLLEKDPRRLIVNWAQSNLKAANLAPGLSRLRNLRNIAHHAGDEEATQFIQRLITDLSGRRSDTVAAWANTKRDNFILKAKRNLNKAKPGTLEHSFYRTLVNAPEIMGTLFNQIYPTLLGLNPRQVVQNLMQPFMMTIPELGYGYGSANAFRAYGKFLASPRKTLKEAETAGFIPAQWSTELREAMTSGIDRGAIQKFSQKNLDRWASFAMYAFEKSEAINRGTSYLLSKQVAQDVLKGNQGVTRFLRSIPHGTRKDILAAKAAGNAQEVERLVTGYIINKTMFNYNRATMSEFGRSMGPLFSTFTKWPASIAGDIYSTLARKGAKAAAPDFFKRYLAPLFIGGVMTDLLFGQKPEAEPEEEQHPVIEAMMSPLAGPTRAVSTALGAEEQDDEDAVSERLLFGKGHGPFRGFAAGSPLGSVEGMVTGRVFKGPALSVVADPVAALVKGDTQGLQKWATSLYKTWVPVLPALDKFIFETLPAIEASVTGSGENPYEENKGKMLILEPFGLNDED